MWPTLVKCQYHIIVIASARQIYPTGAALSSLCSQQIPPIGKCYVGLCTPRRTQMEVKKKDSTHAALPVLTDSGTHSSCTSSALRNSRPLTCRERYSSINWVHSGGEVELLRSEGERKSFFRALQPKQLHSREHLKAAEVRWQATVDWIAGGCSWKGV